MNKFKVGDVVVALEDANPRAGIKVGIVKGCEYTVTKLEHVGTGVYLTDGVNEIGWYYEWRFKLKEGKVKNMNLQFKVGDKVKLQYIPKEEPRDDRVVGICPDMRKNIGKILTVAYINGSRNWISCTGSDVRYRNYRAEWFVPTKPKTYKQLYKEAKELNIAGRSKLNVKALSEAIAKTLDEKEQAKQAEAKRIADEKKALEEAKDKAARELELKTPLGVMLEKKVNGVNSICSFAKEYVNGERWYGHDQPCHYNMNTDGAGPIAKVVFCLSGHLKSARNPVAYKEWVDYIINRSPWANCFLTKDVEEGLKTGFYGDVEQPHSRLSCAVIALRQGSEFKSKLDTWKVVKDKGCSENIACFVSAAVNYADVAGFRLDSIDGGHTVWVGTQSVSDIFKFFNEGWHQPADGPFKNNNMRYKIFNSIASQLPQGEAFRSWITNNTRSLPGDGWTPGKFVQESVWEMCDKLKELIKT